jgi:hypothetical protein
MRETREANSQVRVVDRIVDRPETTFTDKDKE